MMLTGNAENMQISGSWSYQSAPLEENIFEELKTPPLHSLRYLGRGLPDYLRQSRAPSLDDISQNHQSDHGLENYASPFSSLLPRDPKGYDRPSRRRVLAPNNSGDVYGSHAFTESNSSGSLGPTDSHLSEGFAMSEQAEDPVYVLMTPSKTPLYRNLSPQANKKPVSPPPVQDSDSALNAPACDTEVPGVFSSDSRGKARAKPITKTSRFRLEEFPPIFARARRVSFRPYPVFSPPPLSPSGELLLSNDILFGSSSAPSYARPSPSFASSRSPINSTRFTLAFPCSLSFTHTQYFKPSLEIFWLGLYFIFNLTLTLSNKGVLVHFPFPYTLTAIHTFSGSVGCYVLLKRRVFTLAELDFRRSLALVGFSFLYTINIAISNLSLQLVTIPFHQVIRASSPIFTLVLSYALFRTTITARKLLVLMPVILGVALATYGDYHFTAWGLCLTLFGAFLAALKGIMTHVLQTRPLATFTSTSFPVAKMKIAPTDITSTQNLHPLDLLLRMSPLAFLQCILYAWLSGELAQVWEYSCWTGAGSSPGKRIGQTELAALAMNGILAFGLNYVSFTSNKKVGALTMTVAANIKQVLTILLAVSIFNVNITPMNSIGILLTLASGACYAAVEYNENKGTKRPSLGEALKTEKYQAFLIPSLGKRGAGN